METKKFEVEPAQSIITWVGKKVTGAHDGTIEIKNGTLQASDGQLTGGTFTIDTTSIKILDIKDPATNDQFAGHLFSEDFFSVDKFPEATLTITHSVHIDGVRYQIEGNLTIKGITHAVSFPANVVVTNESISASGKILVDRTLYDMKFRSGNFFTNLGDTLIYNEFELNVKLNASATL